MLKVNAAPHHEEHHMRQYRYDFVRAVAITLVIAVHCHFFLDASTPLSSWAYEIAIVPLMTCNPIFFLLSGRLNLRERSDDADTLRYYSHKVRNILIPVLVLFLIRTLFATPPLANDPLAIAKEFAKGTLWGFESTECWFIFELAGMLAVAPFFSHAIAHMSRFEKSVLLGLGVAYNAGCTLLQMLGHDLAWGFPFAGFLLYFIMGGFIEEYLESARVRRTLYVLAIPLVLLTAALMRSGAPRIFYETSPTFIVISLAAYSALLRLGARLRPRRGISFVARHSFTIYLTHMLLLNPLLSLIGAATGLSGIVRWVIMVPVVLLGSLLASSVVDALVITPIKRAYDVAARHLLAEPGASSDR